MTLQPVQPGDLITAEMINLIITRLLALEALVDELGSGTQRVIITDVNPNPVRTGQEITITGRNFEVPVDLNVVTLGTQRIFTFNDASETELVFVVPSLGATRTTTTLTISNNNGSATFPQVIVDPPAPRVPVGQVFIDDNFEDLGTIEERDDPYIFLFGIRSATDIDESYNFDVSFSSAQGASANLWNRTASIVTPEGSELEQPMLLTRNIEQLIGVQVTVPAGAQSVVMTLKVRSQNSPTDPLLNRDFPVTIEVGEEQQTNSGLVNFGTPTFTGSARRAADGTIEVPVGGSIARIASILTFTRAGTYHAEFEYEPAVVGIWSAPDPAETPDTTELANGTESVGVRIRALAADSAADRFLVFRVVGSASAVGSQPAREIDDRFKVRIRTFQP